MCNDKNIDKYIIKLIKMYILVLFCFLMKYHYTMNTFITQLGIYMRDYRVQRSK